VIDNKPRVTQPQSPVPAAIRPSQIVDFTAKEVNERTGAWNGQSLECWR
jgi:hypothetical protein